MAKTAWMVHLDTFRKAHPGMDPKKVFGEAAKTYKKKQSGGTLPQLNPEPISGIKGDSGTGVQMTARLYSGGSKRRGSKRHGSKRHGSKRGTKRRGSKRRH